MFGGGGFRTQHFGRSRPRSRRPPSSMGCAAGDQDACRSGARSPATARSVNARAMESARISCRARSQVPTVRRRFPVRFGVRSPRYVAGGNSRRRSIVVLFASAVSVRSPLGAGACIPPTMSSRPFEWASTTTGVQFSWMTPPNWLHQPPGHARPAHEAARGDSAAGPSLRPHYRTIQKAVQALFVPARRPRLSWQKSARSYRQENHVCKAFWAIVIHRLYALSRGLSNE